MILNVKTNGIHTNYCSLKDYIFLSLWNKHLFQLVLIFVSLSYVVQKCNDSHNSLLLKQQLHKAQLSGEAGMASVCWRNSLPCTEPKVYNHVHNSLPLDPTMTHLNPFYALKYHIHFETHFNIILPSMTRPLEWSLPFRFPLIFSTHFSQSH